MIKGVRMITFYKVKLPADVGEMIAGSYVIVDFEEDDSTDDSTRVFHFNSLEELTEFRAGSAQDHPKRSRASYA
jgi:hypothetical protein